MTHAPISVAPWPRVDLWWIDLTGPWDPGVLSGSELERAGRFRTAELRRRFVARRVTRRLILSMYGDQRPQSLTFQEGRNGKPALADARLHFSASASGEHAVVAVAAREIGVDVEVVRCLSDLERLIETICSAPERARLTECHEAKRTHEFLQLWTIKEAAVKLSGDGLAADLQRVGESSGVVCIEAPDGCVAALAARTRPDPIARRFNCR